MYSIVGVKECFEALDLAPAFESFYGITVSDVVRVKETSEIK